MPKEFSVGIILFSGDEWLLLHYNAGHWGFAKGKPHTGEKLLDAARREVFEETGIQGVFIAQEFKEKESYFFKKAGKTVFKEVVYFLGEAPSKGVKLSEEHTEFKWLKYEEAMNQISFAEAKELLKRANDYRKVH